MHATARGPSPSPAPVATDGTRIPSIAANALLWQLPFPIDGFTAPAYLLGRSPRRHAIWARPLVGVLAHIGTPASGWWQAPKRVRRDRRNPGVHARRRRVGVGRRFVIRASSRDSSASSAAAFAAASAASASCWANSSESRRARRPWRSAVASTDAPPAASTTVPIAAFRLSDAGERPAPPACSL
jgi:hypothetical protein